MPPLAIVLNASNNPNNPNPATINLNVDFAKVTQFGTKFSVNDIKQDGYTAGTMTGLNISKDGSIVATYSNGVKRTEGQLSLASFTNPRAWPRWG